jgi:uncharacterized protein
MKKLILISFVFVPYLLSAQAAASHADSITAANNKAKDSVIRYDKDDIDFSRNLPPRPGTLVTDYTNTLSAKDVQRLGNKLAAFNNLTKAQIAVVVMRSVGGVDIMQYGRKLANNWGIGQKGKNNGVLVLIALNDKKMAILTGAGLESILPDSVCHNIITTDFIPYFKKGNYFGGLDKGTNDIINYIDHKKTR